MFIRSLLRQARPILRLSIRHESTQQNFKAVLSEFGSTPKIVKCSDEYAIRADEVRLKVHYCSLNSIDVNIMSGAVKHEKLQVPLVPGHELSAEVLEVGPLNLNDLYPGERVIALNDLFDLNGALSSQIVVKNANCWKMPQNLSLKEAAVLPVSYGTALLIFSQFCEIKENDRIIVIAGPAGLGLAAIELAVSVFKAKVIAVCDTEESSDLMREKGVYKTINISSDHAKMFKRVKEAMKDSKASVIYDAVGGRVLHLLAPFLSENGQIFSVDPFFDKDAFEATKEEIKNLKKSDQAAVDHVEDLEARIQHISLVNYEDQNVARQMVADTITLWEEGLISAYISRVFKLKRLEKAIEFIRNKECTGKVLIDVKSIQENNGDTDSDEEEGEKKSESKKDD